MKLVEILARKLKEWPRDVLNITQNRSLRVEGFGKCCGFFDSKTECWNGEDYVGFHVTPSILATDHATAIVTREMWEAEKARIAKPAKKANKDGWIRHRGGECPVDKGVMVDVRHRDGLVIENVPAIKSVWARDWSHTNVPGDIMRYRLHTPAIEPAVVENVEAFNAQADITVSMRDPHPENPLIWRDRIREIDTTVEALEEERVSLIQRLADEGLKLLRVDAKAFPKAAIFDPADRETWRTGDLVEIAGSDNISWKDRAGMVGALRYDEGIYHGGWYIKFDSARDWCVSDNTTLKFHSRPST